MNDSWHMTGKLVKHRLGRVTFVSLVVLCLLGSFFFYQQSTATAVVEVESDFVVEYPLPATVPDAQPQNIVAEAPGHLWFTLPGANAVGSLVVTSTVDFEFTIYDLPTANSDPHDLLFDSNENVIWFTQRAVDQIGRLDTDTGQVDEFAMPADSQPTGIALSANGLLWVSLPGTNQIASFDPDSETITPITYDTAEASFTEIAIAQNGLVWVVAPPHNRLVSYNPSNGAFISVVVSDFGFSPFAPHSIAMQDNTPWITVPSKGRIGRYSPGTLNLWFWYLTPNSDGSPTALARRTIDNNQQEFWYIQPAKNYAGRMVIDRQGRLQGSYLTPLPTADSNPSDITVDSQGYAWVTATEANSIVAWMPPYVEQLFLPFIER